MRWPPMPSSPARRSPRPEGASWRAACRLHVYEAGLQQRTVMIEFDSVAQAQAAHDSPAYQEALAVLAGGAERDIRILEGV